MKTNVGNIDRMVHAILSVVSLYLAFFSGLTLSTPCASLGGWR